MVNINTQKAYNSLEWKFLEQILTGLNFPQQFVRWIMACVMTVSYSITIYGSATPPFAAKREVTQGDHIYPYMLVLAMEYLTRILKTLKHKPDFNFHPRCEKMNIIQ